MAEMTPAERGHRALREGGYSTGGHVDVEQDKALVTRAIRQHENAEHGGRHEKLNLRAGGAIKGAKGKSHPGKRGRSFHADGGHVKERGKPGIGKVNIVIAHGPGQAPGGPAAGGPPPVMAPHPPMPAPMPGGPAPGVAGPPMPPRPMMPPPGAMPPPGMMRADGGVMRDAKGRFTGGAV